MPIMPAAMPPSPPKAGISSMPAMLMVATSIQYWATGGLTTCVDWAFAGGVSTPHNTAMAKGVPVRVREVPDINPPNAVQTVRCIINRPCKGYVAKKGAARQAIKRSISAASTAGWSWCSMWPASSMRAISTRGTAFSRSW